jgi:uncharacterized protein (UPF0305 family)
MLNAGFRRNFIGVDMDLYEKLDRLLSSYGIASVIYNIAEVVRKNADFARDDYRQDLIAAADVISNAYQDIRSIFDHTPQKTLAERLGEQLASLITAIVKDRVANSVAAGNSLPENTRNHHRE